MDIGMLWYDDDKQRRFDEKVARAVEYYRTKYGVQPTECYVNPGMLGDEQPAAKGGGAQPAQPVAGEAHAGRPVAGDEHDVRQVAGVRLRANRTVIKNHFWLGVGESGTTPAAGGAFTIKPAAGGGAKAKPRSPKS
jgi:hypothetical protein